MGKVKGGGKVGGFVNSSVRHSPKSKKMELQSNSCLSEFWSYVLFGSAAFVVLDFLLGRTFGLKPDPQCDNWPRWTLYVSMSGQIFFYIPALTLMVLSNTENFAEWFHGSFCNHQPRLTQATYAFMIAFFVKDFRHAGLGQIFQHHVAGLAFLSLYLYLEIGANAFIAACLTMELGSCVMNFALLNPSSRTRQQLYWSVMTASNLLAVFFAGWLFWAPNPLFFHLLTLAMCLVLVHGRQTYCHNWLAEQRSSSTKRH